MPADLALDHRPSIELRARVRNRCPVDAVEHPVSAGAGTRTSPPLSVSRLGPEDSSAIAVLATPCSAASWRLPASAAHRARHAEHSEPAGGRPGRVVLRRHARRGPPHYTLPHRSQRRQRTLDNDDSAHRQGKDGGIPRLRKPCPKLLLDPLLFCFVHWYPLYVRRSKT